jgi:hypothetical protein
MEIEIRIEIETDTGIEIEMKRRLSEGEQGPVIVKPHHVSIPHRRIKFSTEIMLESLLKMWH